MRQLVSIVRDQCYQIFIKQEGNELYVIKVDVDVELVVKLSAPLPKANYSLHTHTSLHFT